MFIFLIFSLFLFHTAEQTFLLFEQSNHHALAYTSGNHGDLEHQMSSDNHSIADALHFSTDIWSSLVVLLGLFCSNLGYYYAATIAALGVAIIVTTISYRLGKRSIDVLLDRAPNKITPQIEKLLSIQKSILSYQNLRVREGGATLFTNFTIKIDPELSIGKAHGIADDIEAQIKMAFPKSEIIIHIEPAEVKIKPTFEV